MTTNTTAPDIKDISNSESNSLTNNESATTSTETTNDKDVDLTKDPSSKCGWTDDQFQFWITKELLQDPLSKEYPQIYEQAPHCITNWRKIFRGNPKLWQRLFRRDKILKEFGEAVPILDMVQRYVENYDNDTEKITILDLCCGKGYLSMLLSELLDPKKVERIVLIDKAWPQHNMETQSHHINRDHIYRQSNIDGQKYFETWPIPLHISKQDLKHANQLRSIQRVFLEPAPGPVILLAIHLCGTLSLRAIDLFNSNPQFSMLALKPCCLPGMVHAKRKEIFQLGHHEFDSKDVCVSGRWKGNKWVGGPKRSHLQQKFQTWSNHLYLGIIVDDSEGQELKSKNRVQVQHGGGYQNDFLFAQRPPITNDVWCQLAATSLSSSQSKETQSENNSSVVIES